MASSPDKFTWIRGDLVPRQPERPEQIDEDDMVSLDRDIGALQEAVATLKSTIAELNRTVAKQSEENDLFREEMQAMINQIKGGAKVATWIWSAGVVAAGAVGGLVAKFMPFLLAMPR